MRRLLLAGLTLALAAGCGKGTSADDGDQGNSGGATEIVGGQGPVQKVRGAVNRTVSRNDLHNIHIFIYQNSLANGRMPTKQQIAAALRKAAPKIHAKVQDGTIVLTGTQSRQGVWAYTRDPQRPDGTRLVITSSGPGEMDPQTLKQRLQQGR